MIKYVFKDPVTIKNSKNANPQKIGESLARISAANHGLLTPHAVVDAAKDAKHPLHKHFEWNDAIAAAQHRVEQARDIIRCIRVEDDTAMEGSKPAFINISDKGGHSYRTVEAVENSIDLQGRILDQADKDLAAFERRYTELTEICALVSSARAALAARRGKVKVESRTAA